MSTDRTGGGIRVNVYGTVFKKALEEAAADAAAAGKNAANEALKAAKTADAAKKTAELAKETAWALEKAAHASSLSEEQKLFLATIAGESIGQGATAWAAIGHVIMNRVADRKHEWKEFNTVTKVIQQPWAFTCYTRQETEYVKAKKYLDNRTKTNELYEELIRVALPIYNNTTTDTTKGAQLYYSPDSMDPPGTKPLWDFDKLVEITISGINSNDFRFYKYK